MKDPIWYKQQKKYQIRGVSSKGSRLEFTVMAYDHAEAEAKAKAKIKDGKVYDVVLITPKKHLI